MAWHWSALPQGATLEVCGEADVSGDFKQSFSLARVKQQREGAVLLQYVEASPGSTSNSLLAV